MKPKYTNSRKGPVHGCHVGLSKVRFVDVGPYGHEGFQGFCWVELHWGQTPKSLAARGREKLLLVALSSHISMPQQPSSHDKPVLH